MAHATTTAARGTRKQPDHAASVVDAKNNLPLSAAHVIFDDLRGQLEFVQEQFNDLEDLYARLEKDYEQEKLLTLNQARFIKQLYQTQKRRPK